MITGKDLMDYGKCPRCNRKVLADSNGDYFSVGETE